MPHIARCNRFVRARGPGRVPRWPALVVLALLCASAMAQDGAAPMQHGADVVSDAPPALRQRVVDWRRDLHAHPELGHA